MLKSHFWKFYKHPALLVKSDDVFICSEERGGKVHKSFISTLKLTLREISIL